MKLTPKQLRDRHTAAKSNVQLGAAYRHKKSGDYYVPRLVCLREEDLVPLVVYGKIGSFDEVAFSRPLEEFLDKFGKVTPPERSR